MQKGQSNSCNKYSCCWMLLGEVAGRAPPFSQRSRSEKSAIVSGHHITKRLQMCLLIKSNRELNISFCSKKWVRCCRFWVWASNKLLPPYIEQMQKSAGKQEPRGKVRANKKQKLRRPVSPYLPKHSF